MQRKHKDSTQLEDVVKIGENMELKNGGVCMKTKLQDFSGNSRFVVSHPTVDGKFAVFAEGDILGVKYYRSAGVFAFDAKVIRWFMAGNLKLLMLEAVTEIVRSQRRKSYRLSIVLDVQIWRADGISAKPEKHKAKTMDISEHGMLLTCFEYFEPGTPVFLDVQITKSEHRIFKAEVLRCEKPFLTSEPKKTGLIFINCSEHDRAYLGRFIMRQQIQARKKRGTGEVKK